jgi:hypothetical protein
MLYSTEWDIIKNDGLQSMYIKMAIEYKVNVPEGAEKNHNTSK